jgi:hypothetical protein
MRKGVSLSGLRAGEDDADSETLWNNQKCVFGCDKTDVLVNMGRSVGAMASSSW